MMLKNTLALLLFLNIWRIAAAKSVRGISAEENSLFQLEQINSHDAESINEADAELEFPAWIDEWTAPAEIQKWFPFYLAGYDKEGSPVYVAEYGHCKFAEALLANSGKGGRQTFKELVMKYLEQGIYTALRHGMANNTQGIVAIGDWDGFSAANYLDDTAVEFCLAQMSMLSRIKDVIKQSFIINTNIASQNLLRVAQPLMGKFLEKSEVYGSDRDIWLPHLLSNIRRNQLPQRYGGEKDWEPVWLAGRPSIISSSYVHNKIDHAS